MIAKGRLSPAKPARESSVEEIGQWMSGLWDAMEPGAAVAASAQRAGKEAGLAYQA